MPNRDLSSWTKRLSAFNVSLHLFFGWSSFPSKWMWISRILNRLNQEPLQLPKVTVKAAMFDDPLLRAIVAKTLFFKNSHMRIARTASEKHSIIIKFPRSTLPIKISPNPLGYIALPQQVKQFANYFKGTLYILHSGLFQLATNFLVTVDCSKTGWPTI